jgi:MFS family permease
MPDRPKENANIQPWLILALVSVPIFIGALDLTIVSAVLPAVLSDLQIPVQTGLDDAAWVVSGYLLAYTVSMTFMGRMSDLWGRKRIYIISLIIFIIGSALVAMSPDAPADVAYRIWRAVGGTQVDRAYMGLYTLIFGRVIQAFGAGALVPISMALVGDIFPPGKRALPLGVIGGVDTAGWVLGHLYGGIMVQYFAWPVLFWLNIPLALIALALTIWALKDVISPVVKEHFDWIGAALIVLALTGLNLALNVGAEPSPSLSPGQEQESFISIPFLLVSLVAITLFVVVQNRSQSPLINLNIFRQRNVSVAFIANLLIGFCIMAGLVSVPLYMNTVPTTLYGLEQDRAALLAGILLSALTVPMALSSVLGGRLAQRIGIRWTSVLGAALAVAGFWLMSHWTADQSQPVVEWLDSGYRRDLLSGTVQMISGLVVAGVGLGFTISPIATAVIEAVSDVERGVASALVIVMRLIGMTVSISALTTYGLRRSLNLRIEGLVGVELTDFATQSHVLVESTTQVIGEIALIASAVAFGAALVSLALKDNQLEQLS